MILKFINREKELRLLEEKYRLPGPQFIPIYGRRRVGKTVLIKQFIHTKPHFYFLAKKKKLDEERERFRLKFSQEFNVFLPPGASWDDLFAHISEQRSSEKLVIVIDEFPFWIEKDKSVVSDFQHLWDETLKDQSMFLILCGSSVSMMETDILGYKSPLYGRRTGQIEVNPLVFTDVRKFFPRWTLEEVIKTYGALDGIPFYLNEFDPVRSFFDNVQNTFWKSGSILNKEVEFLLSQELREVEVYLSILRSIFEGANKLNEIASKSGVDITNVSKYIRVLMNLKFVTTESPVVIARPKRKNFLYKISDRFFSFWLNYVYPFRDDIEIGEIAHLKAFFQKDYDRYLGPVFEGVCKQALRHAALPLCPTRTGRWWYKDKEIDLVGLDEKRREALFIECKWSSLTERRARKILEELNEKARSVEWKRKKEYFGLMAKTIAGKENLRKDGFVVFGLEDMEKGGEDG